MAKYKIRADYDYVMGHLRYGHAELEVDKDEWDSKTLSEKEDYFKDCCNFVLDDYEVEGLGDIDTITKTLIEE